MVASARNKLIKQEYTIDLNQMLKNGSKWDKQISVSCHLLRK